MAESYHNIHTLVNSKEFELIKKTGRSYRQLLLLAVGFSEKDQESEKEIRELKEDNLSLRAKLIEMAKREE
jgi:hypothetical protein